MRDPESWLEAFKDTLQRRSFEAAYKTTFELVKADTDELINKSLRLRHNVFFQEYGYSDPANEGDYIERDAFDDHAVHLLLKHRVSGDIVATARIVLPDDSKPEASFPIQKLCDHPLLGLESRALSLCEISKFCTAAHFRKRPEDGRFLSAYSAQDVRKSFINGKVSFIRRSIPYMQAALLQGAFEAAMQARIMDCLWMVEPEHMESLRQIGFEYRILGPRLDYMGGMQPIIFNIKHVLDNMREREPHCWVIVSDGGRLQEMADRLVQNDWHDALLDEICLERIYRHLETD